MPFCNLLAQKGHHFVCIKVLYELGGTKYTSYVFTRIPPYYNKDPTLPLCTMDSELGAFGVLGKKGGLFQAAVLFWFPPQSEAILFYLPKTTLKFLIQY